MNPGVIAEQPHTDEEQPTCRRYVGDLFRHEELWLDAADPCHGPTPCRSTAAPATLESPPAASWYAFTSVTWSIAPRMASMPMKMVGSSFCSGATSDDASGSTGASMSASDNTSIVGASISASSAIQVDPLTRAKIWA